MISNDYLKPNYPIHPASMSKWRNRLGKDGVEKRLVETINTGLKSKTIKPNSLTKVTVDTSMRPLNYECNMLRTHTAFDYSNIDWYDRYDKTHREERIRNK